MADLVQQNMEDMIPELSAFSSLKILESDEIQRIIKIRKDYEFQIINNDPVVSKKGYRQYINFEKQLDKVIKQRIKSLNLPKASLSKKRRKKRWKKGMIVNTIVVKSDPVKIARIAISRRIHFLYKRAIMKFTEDTKLWVEYIIYCVNHKSHKQAENGLWNLLSKRPNDINLWLYTASITLGKKGIEAAIMVLTRSIRNVQSLKLYQVLLDLHIESAYENFKNGVADNDLSAWSVIVKYATKNLPSHEIVLFILSTIDKLCKVMVNGRFRDSLVDFDKFTANINDILYEKSATEPLVLAYIWRVQFTELMLEINNMNVKNAFEQLFINIIDKCKNDPFKSYLLCALLYFTFNEPDFFTIENHSDKPEYLLTFTSEEMIKLFPARTKLLLHHPELLTLANLSPYISQKCRHLYNITTPTVLVKTKEFITGNLNTFMWNDYLETIVDHLIQGNSSNGEELDDERATCITSILQVLKSCGKNYRCIMEKVANIMSGILVVMIMIDDISFENFEKLVKTKNFRVTKQLESELLVDKMLELTRNQFILYELFDHFNEDLLSHGIEKALSVVPIKKVPNDLKPLVKMKLCEVIIKSNSIQSSEMILLFSVHQNRLEAMEQQRVDKNVEIAGWLEYIEFSRKFRDMFPDKCDVPSPGVIYNKAVARFGHGFIY